MSRFTVYKRMVKLYVILRCDNSMWRRVSISSKARSVAYGRRLDRLVHAFVLDFGAHQVLVSNLLYVVSKGLVGIVHAWFIEGGELSFL
jgi:hypothetical protein